MTKPPTWHDPNYAGPKISDADIDSMLRSSPALAVADRLMRFNADREEPSLADRFIASTYTEGRKMAGRSRRAMDEAMLKYRVEMRHSHRFILTDDFVEMATHMSMVPATKTLARLQYATLPYDTTWIEFNLRAKMKVIKELYAHDMSLVDVGHRMGMLLQRINDTDAVCTLVSEIDGDATPHITCYFFSTEERAFDRINGPTFGSRVLSLTGYPGEPVGEDHVGKACLWGYTGKHSEDPAILTKQVSMPYRPERDDMFTPEFLLRHGDPGVTRMHDVYKTVAKEKGDPDTIIVRLIATELKEFTGTVRWLITVLAMLNEVPVHSEQVIRSHQMRINHFTKHKLVDYHRVSLKLPKKNPIKYYERRLNPEEIRRRKAHEVRAHWRTYLHAEHCGYEEHDWTYDNDSGYRLCGKCMAYGRLIHEHIRGNADLGWVRKDYVLKPAT